jgi:gluconate kinase
MIIAITGPAGSGKDTLAENIVKNLGYVQSSFAGPLKEFCEKVLGRPLDKGTERDLLIYVGEYLKGHKAPFPEILKNNNQILLELSIQIALLVETQKNYYKNKPFQDSFWAEIWAQETEAGIDTVISDIRFPAEFKYLRNQQNDEVVFVELVSSRENCEKRLLQRDGKIPEGLWESRAENAWKSERKDLFIDVDICKTPDKVFFELHKFLVEKGYNV